jgi:hypothetical protein
MEHTMNSLIRILKRAATTALAAAALLASPALVAPACAQSSTSPSVSYHIDFTTDAGWIANPTDPVAMHYAMWKTPVQMASLRSAPFIRVTNDSTSSLQMQSVRIDLADPNYAFDSFAYFEQPDDGVANLVSHTDTSFGGDMQPFLEFQFPQGLDPGDSFTFQVRIAKLSGAGVADYETVLWDKANATSPDRLDNALVAVTYNESFTGGGNVPFAMTPVRLFEFPTSNATFPVDANGASGSNVALMSMYDMSNIGFATFNQTAIVPEPGTASLLIAAVGCIPAVRWRRRRRAAHC